MLNGELIVTHSPRPPNNPGQHRFVHGLSGESAPGAQTLQETRGAIEAIERGKQDFPGGGPLACLRLQTTLPPAPDSAVGHRTSPCVMDLEQVPYHPIPAAASCSSVWLVWSSLGGTACHHLDFCPLSLAMHLVWHILVMGFNSQNCLDRQ